MVIEGFVVLALSQAGGNPYADPRTREVVSRARARHAARDTAIHDYRAVVRTRIDMAQSRGRFAQQDPLGVVEYITTLHWTRAGHARLEYVGLRKQYAFRMLPGPIPFFDIDQDDLDDPRLDEPWIIPYTLGDSVRVICCDFQAHPALHPLAREADGKYRFAARDSIELRFPDATLHMDAVDVIPLDDVEELIVGRMWIERESGAVVRFIMKFVGDRIFASNTGDILNRVFQLEADIEYARIDGFWLPARQMVTLEAHDRWITNAVIPLRFQMEFDDYRVNTLESVGAAPSRDTPLRLDTIVADDPETARALDVVRAARQPDGQGGVRLVVRDMAELVRAIRLLESRGIDSGLRINSGNPQNGESFNTTTGENGVRWVVASPAIDSLEGQDVWRRPLRLGRDVDIESQWRAGRGVLDSLAGASPAGNTVPGASGMVSWGELFRFNRVQGLTVGTAYTGPPRVGAWAFGSGRGRLGLADGRPVFALGVTRVAPAVSIEASGYRIMRDVGPFSDGHSIGNTLNALLAGHDDADYLMATGAALRQTRAMGLAAEWTWSVGVEDHRTVRTEANGGLFGSAAVPNPGVDEGWWGIANIAIRGRGLRTAWNTGVDLGANDRHVVGRWWGTAMQRAGPLALRVTGGMVSTDAAPQALLRVGGPATVRGHAYGARRGTALVAAQLEMAFPSMARIRPILFADVGDAGPIGDLFGERPVAGVGAALAIPLFLAEARLEVSRPVAQPNRDGIRVDLRIQP